MNTSEDISGSQCCSGWSMLMRLIKTLHNWPHNNNNNKRVILNKLTFLETPSIWYLVSCSWPRTLLISCINLLLSASVSSHNWNKQLYMYVFMCIALFEGKCTTYLGNSASACKECKPRYEFDFSLQTLNQSVVEVRSCVPVSLFH